MNKSQKTSRPVVTVCMITYNHELYIKEAIEGVLMQKTNFPFELIIGEDSSTDNTYEICLEYAKNYNNIKLYHNNPNIGAIPNFVKTLERAQSRYIALCEGDDYWVDPEKLQKQVDYLECHPETVLTYHNVIAQNILSSKKTRDDVNKIFFSFKPERIPVGHYTHTSSMVFRNIIKNYPSQMLDVISGDSFLQFLLSRYGNSTFLANVYPNIRRRHNKSVWSYKDSFFKASQSVLLYEKLLEIAVNEVEIKAVIKNLIKSRSFFIRVVAKDDKKEAKKHYKKTLKDAYQFKHLLYFWLYHKFADSQLYTKRLHHILSKIRTLKLLRLSMLIYLCMGL